MKYFYNLHNSDIEDLAKDGKILIDVNNASKDIALIKLKNKLGAIKGEIKMSNDFDIAEWSGMYTQDIVLTGNSSESLFGLNFIFEGMWSTTMGRANNLCKAGTNFLWGANKDSVSSTGIKKGTYCSSLNIVFHIHYLEYISNRFPGLFNDCFTKGGMPDFTTKNTQTSIEMIHVLSQIKNAHLMGNACDIYTESKVLELLALQVQNDINYKENSNCNRFKNISDIERIHEAKRLLILNLNQSPTIPELSKQVGINECKLKYGFKEVYNKTIYQYLFEHKMNLAQNLLLNTSYTVYEIAYQCGYDEPSHFSNAFKRKYGINPRDYRNKA